MSLEPLLDTITAGDALELSSGIPDESFDLVFCDPPYLKCHIEAGIYSWLAQEAARVLKPGGFCLAYTGGEWLPRVLSQMQEYLNFFWGCILKRFHIWGQDERTASYYIDCFSRPGDLVFDPFCGGGTIPYVCKQIHRHFIAFEIDPDVANVARKRLQTVQPVLFSENRVEQMSFEGVSA